PAFFIAHLNSSGEHTSTERFGQFLVFTRVTADAPWQLAIETFTRDYDSERLVLPRPDDEGYVPAAPLATPPAVNVPRVVAEFLQHSFMAGTPPPGSPIVATPDATRRGHILFDRTHVAGIAITDARVELPDRLLPDALFEIDSPSGISLLCFSMHYAEGRDGSWWRPVGLHWSQVGEPPDGAYLRLRAPVLEQDCVAVNAGARITLIADQTAYEPRIAVAAPVPWFPIGAAGLALMGMVAILVLGLRPGGHPASPTSPTPDLRRRAPRTSGPPGVCSRSRPPQGLGEARPIEFVAQVIDYEPRWRFETLLDDRPHHQTTPYTLRPVKAGTEVTSALRIELGP